MKKVVFDHNVPLRLARILKTFDVKLARELRWQELKNGKLIEAAERSGFDVLLTADRTIPTENQIAGRKIGLVCMSTNNWKIVRDRVPAIAEALHKCKPSQVLEVDCGGFSRRKPAKQARPRPK